jgi:sulfate permease, SulP family
MTARSRVAALLPGLAVLRRYERSWWRLDVVAGTTVGAMLIPQSMAYAELAGMPPEYGFYAVLGALVVYALVGTSRHLGVGPEPGTAILAATGVGTIAAGDPTRYVALIAALALVVAGMSGAFESGARRSGPEKACTTAPGPHTTLASRTALICR